MSKVKGFSFYRSYYDVLEELDKNDQKEFVFAIINYVFNDEEPNFKSKDIKKAIWVLVKPNLDKSKNKSNENAGAPEDNQNAKQSKNNQNSIKKQSKNNQLHQDNSLSLSLSNSLSYSNSNIQSNNILNNLFIEYIKLREENKYNTSETVICRLINKLNTYGQNDEDKKEIIENAIMGKWKDFYEIDNKKKKEVVKYETVR